MFRRLFATRTPKLNRADRRLLRLEPLETREVPSVTLADITESQIPTNKPLFVPVTVTDTPNGAVSVAVSSSDPTDVSAEVVQGGQSVRFNVSGTDANGVPFSGSLTIRLFTDAAPQAAQRIIDLVNSGYYNGKNFPRVLNNFMIQGGGTSTSDNSPLPSYTDEFNAAYTFDSPGILAMANSGDDTNNSQFFITDPKVPVVASTTGGPTRPQYLNFNYSVVGILTDGFDVYQKIITTPVSNNGSGEVSKPNSTITITGATVFTDTKNAVVKLTPHNNFTGSANVSVTATDADGAAGAATKSFTVAGVNDGVKSPPFITTPIPNQTTTAGTPVTFTVPTTDIDGDPVTIAVKDPTFTTAPANVTVSIDQATGKVTVTPNAGFTGATQFKVGVRATSATDTASNYDTQLVNLAVTPASTTPTPPTPSNTGPFTASGSVAGLSGSVTVKNSDGSVRFTVPVFDGFTGGIRVATGDVNGDGTQDVVAVPGYGGSGQIVVLSSVDGSVIRTAKVFESTFRGGLNLKVADAQGLGYAQVFVGAGNSGGPRVTVLDFKNGKELLNFFAGNSTLRGGVDVDVADVFAGKPQMIVTSMGPGAGPQVSLYNATTAAFVGSFLAGDSTDRNGIDVRVGDRPSSTAARPIFVTPFGAPDGTVGTSYDPSKFINPDKPATTTSTTTANGQTFDLSSLMNGSNG